MLDKLYVDGSVNIHLMVKDLIDCIFGHINEYCKPIELTQLNYLAIEMAVEKVLEKHTSLACMSFNEYQEKAATTALYYKKIDEEFPDLNKKVRTLLGLAYVSLGLGESGEVQGKIKKVIRDSGGNITQEVISAIKGELGDQLWYISQMCRELGITIQDVADSNIEKLFSRKERGVITGSGDNR